MHDHEYLSLIKSTIVRLERAPRSPWPLRLTGATLSALAPATAARLAARAFLTPPRYRIHEAEARVLGSARPAGLQVNGGRVQTWTWGAGPVVLLVHGWGGRGAQLAAFVEPLRARGFAVVTLDAPGHGASEGRQSTLPRIAAALEAIAEAHGPVHGLIAHSAGALAATRAIAAGLAPAAAVFVGPPADLVGPSLVFAEHMGLSRRVREHMQRHLEERVGVPWSAFDITRLAPSLSVPLLVLHDRGDGEVPWQNGARIAQAWPGANLLTTDGLGHRRILRDPMVVAGAASFIAAHPVRGDHGAAAPAAEALVIS
jgi:pimeloyl-ACP methyl ester carboxylesterase